MPSPRRATPCSKRADDGQPVLRDLGTKNGVVHLGRRTTGLVLTGDTVIRIGHTSLRVRGADFPVGPEMVDRTMHGWEGGIPGLVGLLLIGAFALITTWFNDTLSFQLIRYLLGLAYGIGAGLVWSGAWAFANRLFGRHARLGRHLFIFGCGLAAILAYKIASSAAAYAFSLEALTGYSSHVVIAIVAGVIFFHLGTVKPHQTRRFALACLVLALIGSGLTLISNQQRYGTHGGRTVHVGADAAIDADQSRPQGRRLHGRCRRHEGQARCRTRQENQGRRRRRRLIRELRFSWPSRDARFRRAPAWPHRWRCGARACRA